MSVDGDEENSGVVGVLHDSSSLQVMEMLESGIKQTCIKIQ